MAATRLVSGILREIWQDAAGQPGGPPQPITTGIRISTEQLQRVRALLVIDSVVGAALASASASVNSAGYLELLIFNGAVGTTLFWTLDVQLTHSMQQALDHRTPLPSAYIAVVNGYGVGGVAAAQNLAQTYAFGASAANQTMIVDTSKGGGVIIDGSTAVVTAPGRVFEVRQNSAQFTPMEIAYRGNANTPAWLYFSKARGTFAAPAQIATADLLGGLAFTGYSRSIWYDLAAISVYAVNVGAAPDYFVQTAIDFDCAYDSSKIRAFRMRLSSSAGGGVLVCMGNGAIIPEIDNQGQLGSPVATAWGSAAIYEVYALGNLRLGFTTGAGATHTLVCPNDTVFPAGTPTNRIYLGSVDWTEGSVTLEAALAISAEALAWTAQAAVDYQTGIPLVYNGKNFLLLARDMTPG